MKLGLFTALFSELSLEEMLQKVKGMGFEAVELYTAVNGMIDDYIGQYSD